METFLRKKHVNRMSTRMYEISLVRQHVVITKCNSNPGRVSGGLEDVVFNIFFLISVLSTAYVTGNSSRLIMTLNEASSMLRVNYLASALSY